MNTLCRFAMNDFVRLAVLAAGLTATVAFAAPAPATDIEDAGPVFNAGSQYTAVLDQAAGRWQILPLTGHDLAIDTADCASGARHPAGVWLVSFDAEGRVQLVAPSTTALPPGVADTIPVRNCEDAGADALAVPQPLIDLLAADAGAVLIQ
jgi:hypothetical protein